jgi:integrase
MAKVLTQAALDALKPSDRRREVPDAKVAGLNFILQPSGKASWAFRFRWGGKTAKLTLGPSPAVDLPTARNLARKAAAELAIGVDPRAKKRAAKAEARETAESKLDQIETVVEAFLRRYAMKRTRENTWKETERLLTREVVVAWKGRRLSSIRRAEIHAMLDKIVDRPAPVTANRTFSALRQLCEWCVERQIIELSPCTGVKAPSPEQSRDRTLSDDEIRAGWKAFDAVGYPFGDLAKMLLLLGQRLREIASAPWSEFDLEGKVWRLPAERTKNNTSHEIPLSDAVLRILGRLPRIEAGGGQAGFLFTANGRKPIDDFHKGKRRIDALMLADLAVLPRWTLHDLRRSCASGMAELGIAPHIVEAVLNHRSGTIRGVARIYNRFDYRAEKRAALLRWADHVERLASGVEAENVVELAARR